jgi:uncharacterized repeat protein (TIGR03803 family)
LTLSGTTLYGMTEEGGANADGNVFSVGTNGANYKNIVSFTGTGGSAVGDNPFGSLILSGTTLYGVTVSGGANADGNIFSVGIDGTGYRDLYDFTGGTDGGFPVADLTLSGGTLFGMTNRGGTNGDGTVFALALPAPTPEPGTLALLGACFTGLIGWARRKRKQTGSYERMLDKTMVRSLVAVALVATMFAGTAVAQVVLPTDLPPGSQYEIAFVTSDGTTATSTDINDYNSFVTAEAALSSSLPTGVTWNAMASTLTTNAIDNAPTYATVPIYNTAGQLVASGSSQLWLSVFANPIGFDEFGNPSSASKAWTGTGHGLAMYPLGEFPLEPGNPDYIETPSFVFLNTGGPSMDPWFSGYLTGDSAPPQSILYPLYALSSPITVPVPEPSTLALLGVGALGLLGCAWRRRLSRLARAAPRWC